MSEKNVSISESEYAVMRVLWEADGPMTVSDVMNGLGGSEWTPSTVSTFLQRLCAKGAAAFEKKGKANLYYPLLDRASYGEEATESFLAKLYDGSAKNLVAALCAKGRLSKDDLDELRRQFDL